MDINQATWKKIVFLRRCGYELGPLNVWRRHSDSVSCDEAIYDRDTSFVDCHMT
jgi:predicted ATP-grasp superfamily ATP-dependent carboligase